MRKKKPAMGLEAGWEVLEVSGISKLKRILEGMAESQFTYQEFMTLYTVVYDLCTQTGENNHSEDLYTRYNKVFVDYISSTVLPSLRRTRDEFLLKEFVKSWANHNLMFRWLRRVFHYVDRYYVPRYGKKPLKEASRHHFMELVYKKMQKRVAAAAIGLIAREREGERIDRSLLKNVLDVLVEIGVGTDDSMDFYVNGFEDAMLEDTAEYYASKASDWIGKDSCSEFMLKAEECLKREEERVAHYLHASTEPKLMEQVRNQLLIVHENQLLENERSGCLALLRDDKVGDLARMHRLFNTVKSQGLHLAAHIFKRHVIDVGTALVKQAEDAASSYQKSGEKEMAGLHQHNFIQKVIEQHDKYLAYVSVDGCFKNDSLFHIALQEAFEVFCNKSISRSCSADMLASFCDRILKKGGADKLSHEEIEETLDKAVKVLAYISDKDLFGEFYRKKMARRLLFDTSVSNEHERSIITKLKQKCGGQFTSKMEGMFTDKALAKEKQRTFEEYLDANPNVSTGGVDLTVTVLTTGFWPSYKSHDVNLPKEMAKCVEVFKEFYQTSTKHRRLSWIYSMGSCNVLGNFEKRPTEMVVTTYQACVLMLFNSCDRLSYSDIVTQLNLGEDDVKRLLHSLSCARYKVLSKEPNTKTISPSDVFEFNSKFTDKMRKIKIPFPPLDENKKVIEDVNNDRRYTIDATIVRIMKNRKVLKYQQLVTQCVEQVSSMFKPDFKVIKKRVEDLVERDYLARDDQDPNTFKFVA